MAATTAPKFHIDEDIHNLLVHSRPQPPSRAARLISFTTTAAAHAPVGGQSLFLSFELSWPVQR
jgi:hypothetical protein